MADFIFASIVCLILFCLWTDNTFYHIRVVVDIWGLGNAFSAAIINAQKAIRGVAKVFGVSSGDDA